MFPLFPSYLKVENNCELLSRSSRIFHFIMSENTSYNQLYDYEN